MNSITTGRGAPPPQAPQGGNNRKYPWADLAEGAFFDLATDRQRVSAQCSGRAWCRTHRPDLQCVTRRVGEVYRVWLMPLGWQQGG